MKRIERGKGFVDTEEGKDNEAEAHQKRVRNCEEACERQKGQHDRRERRERLWQKIGRRRHERAGDHRDDDLVALLVGSFVFGERCRHASAS